MNLPVPESFGPLQRSRRIGRVYLVHSLTLANRMAFPPALIPALSSLQHALPNYSKNSALLGRMGRKTEQL